MQQNAIDHPTTQPLGWVHVPSHWPGQVDLISWCQNMGPGLAAVLVLLGIVYLLFGFYLHKALVVFNATFVGVCVGATIGDHAGAAMPGAILGGFIAAAATLPFMKWAVAVMGGLFGTLLGGSLWRIFGFDPTLVWSGALLGLVACGLLCFIVFRGCVMTYMSLQGAVMLVIGILGLVYKYDQAGPTLTSWMQIKPFLLPLCIFVPTVLGIMYQQNVGTVPVKK